METTGIRQGMGIMHSDVVDTFSIVVHDTLCHKIEYSSIGSSLIRMNKILSYGKCTGFTGNFSLTLSIFWKQQICAFDFHKVSNNPDFSLCDLNNIVRC